MKDKTLILHIGMPKTGTTSIQDAFAERRLDLERLGIHYPAARPYNHSFTFGAIFCESRRETNYFVLRRIDAGGRAAQTIDQFKADWNSQFARSRCEKFVISAELLCTYTSSEIRAVHDFVGEHFNRVGIIAYVRPPMEAIASRWAQKIRMLSADLSKQEILDGLIEEFRYSFIRDWASVFGRDAVTVRPFAKTAFPNGNLLDDFMVSIGAEEGVFPPLKARNKAFGHNALALLYECNRRYPVFVDDQPNPEKGLSKSLRPFFSLLNSVEDRDFELDIAWSEAQAKRMNAEIDLVNEFLPPDERFSPVRASEDGKSRFPEFDDIPKDYIIELINSYNKKIEESRRASNRDRRFVGFLRRIVGRRS